MCFTLQASAQTIIAESFDNATFPPTGWQSVATSYTGGSGQQAWYRVTAGTYPTCSPHSGAGMASYNIFSIYSGSKTELRTPALNFSTFTSGSRMVSFWMYRDGGYLSYNEGVNVYVNTTATVTGGTLLGTVNRATNMTPIETGGNGWYQYSFLVPNSFSGTTNYIIFEGYSDYGNNEFIDDIDIFNFVPCPVTSGLALTARTSTSANLTWNAVPGSAGYEYVIDQSATAPVTTPTFTATPGVNKTGLTPATTYYLHVRNRCTPTGSGPGNISQWTDFQFSTYPPCTAPTGFATKNLTAYSAIITWRKLISATSYDYLVDQDRNDPISSTGLFNTTDSFDAVNGLLEDTKYYVHIRANCAGSEQSPWALDSFTTPLVCRAPEVKVTYVNTENAVAYWEAIPTATKYEFVISKSGITPPNGTEISQTYQNLSALNPGTIYYVYVRSQCTSQGVDDKSEWGKASFATWALGVKDINSDNFNMEAYPNPAKNTLNININGAVSTGAQLLITDITGKILYSQPAKTNENQIDIHKLSAGIYFVKYHDRDNQQTIKFAKQ
jgi:hypothetical protein